MELMSHLFTPKLRGRTIATAKKHGITVPITYCGGPMHTVGGAEKTTAVVLEVAEVAAAAGTNAINLNPDPIGRAKTDDELSVQAANLNRLGEALGKRGQKLFVHHHNPEMADNAREWRYTLRHTDPAIVHLCVDTHWAYRGGQDWMAIVHEAGRRLASLHLRNSVNGVWSESFGPGDLDYNKLSDYLKREKLTPYLVVELAYEQKTPHTHTLEENLREGREYAERVFRVTA
jgi:inosose dehydratase